MAENPLYEQIIKHIRRQIEGGELLPGEKTPSIGRLCETFRVSSVTAVRALKELTAAGLLQMQPGRGYFVSEQGPAYSCMNIGCLLRGNYLSIGDHYFDEVVNGIQEIAALARVNLIQSHLAALISRRQMISESEFINAALEMNGLVAGFLIDERLPDTVVRTLLEKTGKPAVIVNRATTLPIFAVAPDYRNGFAKMLETLMRMRYDRFLFLFAGIHLPATVAKEEAMRSLPLRFELKREHFRFIKGCSTDPFHQTMERIGRGIAEMRSGRCAIFSISDGLARDVLEALILDGRSVPGEVALVAPDGTGSTVMRQPEISSLKVDTVQIGSTALQLLLNEINRNSPTPPQTVLMMPNLMFGETI